jgi:hypothetical protein
MVSSASTRRLRVASCPIVMSAMPATAHSDSFG